MNQAQGQHRPVMPLCAVAGRKGFLMNIEQREETPLWYAVRALPQQEERAGGVEPREDVAGEHRLAEIGRRTGELITPSLPELRAEGFDCPRPQISSRALLLLRERAHGIPERGFFSLLNIHEESFSSSHGTQRHDRAVLTLRLIHTPGGLGV